MIHRKKTPLWWALPSADYDLNRHSGTFAKRECLFSFKAPRKVGIQNPHHVRIPQTLLKHDHAPHTNSLLM